MVRWLSSQHFFVLLMALSALAMLGPAFMAVALDDLLAARSFAQSAILFTIISLLISLATHGYESRSPTRSQLLALLGAYTFLPLIFAVPFYASLPRVGFYNSWFEMISSFTTTGATLFESSTQLSQTLHFWRAIVGWLGGMLFWVTAIALFAPLGIGGFEIRNIAVQDTGNRFTQIARKTNPAERLARHAIDLVPIYVGLTALLWGGLTIAGETAFVGLCHAMAILATSGISPVGGLSGGSSGVTGEMVIVLFFIFALSRRMFTQQSLIQDRTPIWQDIELRLAAVLVVGGTAVLMARHWFVSVGTLVNDTFMDFLLALWGTLFTILSFLTTTGFESTAWDVATAWNGLQTPGLILVGASLVGGGVATSAGGVKLLRVFALYKHGLREVDKLIHPHSVGGSGAVARHIRKQGATIAWVFFMLFALSVAAFMILLSLTGIEFQNAMVLTVSALSTNGPLAFVAAEQSISYSGIPELAKFILAVAMILGRLETLAIIALLNPDIWRR